MPKEKREGFTLKQYEAAKAELWQELEWVATTREYLHRLSQPFAENGLKSYVTVQEIGDKIYKESSASDSNTSLEWVEFTSIMLKLAGPLTLHATNTLGELLDLGVWAFGSTPEGRPTYDGVEIKAHELGSALMKQMESTVGTYRAMGDVIVSDPKKLAEVGKHGGCNPEKGSCPSGFAFNEEDKLEVSAGLSRSVQRLSYERLVPLAYEVFKLRHKNGPETTPPDPQRYACGFAHPWSEFSPARPRTGIGDAVAGTRPEGWPERIPGADAGPAARFAHPRRSATRRDAGKNVQAGAGRQQRERRRPRDVAGRAARLRGVGALVAEQQRNAAQRRLLLGTLSGRSGRAASLKVSVDGGPAPQLEGDLQLA